MPGPIVIDGYLGSNIAFGEDGSITLDTGEASLTLQRDGSIRAIGHAGGSPQNGLFLAADGAASLESGGSSVLLNADGSVNVASAAGQSVALAADGSVQVWPGAGGFRADLPDSDPYVAGQWWNDNGTVRVSAG